jgi:hypothetical protein
MMGAAHHHLAALVSFRVCVCHPFVQLPTHTNDGPLRGGFEEHLLRQTTKMASWKALREELLACWLGAFPRRIWSRVLATDGAEMES